MKLTKIDLITIAMAILVPACAYFGYFKRHISELGRLSAQTADLDTQAADRDKVADEIALARKNLRKLERRIGDFMGSLSSEDDAQRAVGTIVLGAKEAGIHIESMRPGQAVEGKTLSYLPINLSASGEFHRFFDFLLRIERDKTVMTVSRMEVESDALAKRCAVKLELRIYFIKSQPKTGKEART